MQARVAGVGCGGAQRLAEILKIAIEIDVLIRHAADVREAMGVERVDVEHGYTGSFRLVSPLLIMQRKHLYARAAIAFYAVAGAADDQKFFRIESTIKRHVYRQIFVVFAFEGMRERRDGETGGGSGL